MKIAATMVVRTEMWGRQAHIHIQDGQKTIVEELVYKKTCCYGAILTLCIKLPFVSTLAYKCPVRCTKFNHVLVSHRAKNPSPLNDSYPGTETDQYNIILRARMCPHRTFHQQPLRWYTHFMSTWSR
jgi:hypothetical protein